MLAERGFPSVSKLRRKLFERAASVTAFLVVAALREAETGAPEWRHLGRAT